MSTPDTAAPALELRDLEVAYRVRGIDRTVLRGVSFHIATGESYGLVGESGCGKSTAALTVVRYLPRNGRVPSGSISVAGVDALALGGRELREFHARTVSMVYQNPGAALNPSIRVGAQVAEAFTVLGMSKGEADDRSRAALDLVQIGDNYQFLDQQWWTVLFPALAIASLVVAVNLVSDSVQQVLER